MAQTNKLKIFNDPIYGFIGTPNEFIYNLIGHPYFQRLRRISQMGMSYLVYPGAHHTRFHHALGSMHLMRQAIEVLRYKKVAISSEEENALLCAILLHDIGHGPFSHALEEKIYLGNSHEKISLGFMKSLNDSLGGGMDMAIAIFEGNYRKPFMNELISSQLDMDRLDYLKRDSFYTGVTEGNINSERLITMLNVADGHLVVEEKGIYAVEKFLMARRFMYWQVYLHKTSLVAELLLIKVVERVKSLLKAGSDISCSEPLLYFLKQDGPVPLNEDLLKKFAFLDDVDVLSAIKRWQFHDDEVLSRLCKMLLNRKLLKIKIRNKPAKEGKVAEKQKWVAENYGVSDEESGYFVFSGKIDNKTYDLEHQNINILKKNSTIIDVAKASDHLALQAFSKTTTKYYLCYPKASVSELNLR
ncbi:HD domain-containing protein [Allomuricauda sp. d1]|uniref:HD domain-containing protein n=1 Tax=Allomuricauda sp. d1 TaxID=3136725 RepID=UPI0031CE0E64